MYFIKILNSELFGCTGVLFKQTSLVVITQEGLQSDGSFLSLQGTETEEDVVREFEADETVRFLLEKLHFYENKIR